MFVPPRDFASGLADESITQRRSRSLLDRVTRSPLSSADCARSDWTLPFGDVLSIR
jgi:hypothetical protein